MREHVGARVLQGPAMHGVVLVRRRDTCVESLVGKLELFPHGVCLFRRGVAAVVRDGPGVPGSRIQYVLLLLLHLYVLWHLNVLF